METNSMAAPFSSAGFTVGGVLSRTFAVVKQRFGLLFGIACVPSLLATIFGLLAGFLFLRDMPVGQPPSGATFWVVGLVGFIWFTAGMAVLGAFCYAVFSILAGNSITFSAAVSAGLKRLVPLLLTAIVTGIMIYIGFVLFFIPGLVLLCLLNVVIPVCMVEKRGVVGSIKRSAALTKGCRWKILGLMMLAVVAYIIAFIAMFLISYAITAIFPMWIGVILRIIWQLGFSVVMSMYMYAMISVTYHDLRVAKEGVTASSLINVFD